MRSSSRYGVSLARVALALVVVAGAGLVAAAPNVGATGSPPVLTAADTANVYFFPFSSFSDTTTSSETYVDSASNVTVTVLDSSNAVVKTLLNSASVGPGYVNQSWNGTNTAGTVVPNGTYTIQVTASNSGGSATPVTYTRHVASGTPGTLTTPTAGATLSGVSGFVFTPNTGFTATFPITYVSVSCLGSASAASGNGTWQGSADTNTSCGNGVQSLSDSVNVTDPLGATHYWSGPTTSVTIANAPTLTSGDAANAYFFPSGNGFGDTTTSEYTCVSKPATVNMSVLDSTNTVVKTLLNNVSESSCFDPYWDGTNTAGTIVPNGTYTIQVTASNSGGSATPVTYTRHVASGTPGTLTTPTAGATLSGVSGFVFTPNTSFTSTFPITYVSVSCLGSASAASGNGTWQGSADTNTSCGNGVQSLSDSVNVTDPLGATHYWSGPTTSVTIANAPTLTSGDAANAYFFPSGNGFGDTTTSEYTYVSKPATVNMSVLDSTNTVVKTLLNNVSESSCFDPFWDGTNTAGTIVPNGTYTIKVTATASGGSATPLTYTRHVASGTPGHADHADVGGDPLWRVQLRVHPEHVVHIDLPHHERFGVLSGLGLGGQRQRHLAGVGRHQYVMWKWRPVAVGLCQCDRPAGCHPLLVRAHHLGDHRQRPHAHVGRRRQCLLLPVRQRLLGHHGVRTTPVSPSRPPSASPSSTAPTPWSRHFSTTCPRAVASIRTGTAPTPPAPSSPTAPTP